MSGVNVLLMGPPGSGKGTQGELLADRLQLEHIAAGDLLRAEIDSGSDLGDRVRGYLERGELVPDDEITALVMPAVLAAAAGRGYLLDGFPRTLDQARDAETRWTGDGAAAAPDAVVVLTADDDVLVERALARGRDDDAEDVVRRRLAGYEDDTAPVVAFYREKGLTRLIDATMPVEDVTDAILAELDVPRA